MKPTLREEIDEILSKATESYFKAQIEKWILKYGQEGFDRLVEENRNAWEHASATRPDLFVWVPKIRKILSRINFEPERWTERICEYLEEKGLVVTEKHRQWIYAQIQDIYNRICRLPSVRTQGVT
jgi:hypothetical protein